MAHILMRVIFFIALNKAAEVSKAVNCVDVEGTAPTGGTLKSVATCSDSTHSITSCGSKPATTNFVETLGSRLTKTGCISYSELGGGTRAIARCCDLQDYTKSFVIVMLSDKSETTASCSSGTIIGCTTEAVGSATSGVSIGLFVGNAGDAGTVDTTFSTLDTCTSAVGSVGSSVYTAAVCYDTSTITDGWDLNCVSVWGEAATTSTVSCPTDKNNYFMTSCTAYNTNSNIKSYQVVNDVCTAQHESSGSLYANAICCRMTKDDPSITTTEPPLTTTTTTTTAATTAELPQTTTPDTTTTVSTTSEPTTTATSTATATVTDTIVSTTSISTSSASSTTSSITTTASYTSASSSTSISSTSTKSTTTTIDADRITTKQSENIDRNDDDQNSNNASIESSSFDFATAQIIVSGLLSCFICVCALILAEKYLSEKRKKKREATMMMDLQSNSNIDGEGCNASAAPGTAHLELPGAEYIEYFCNVMVQLPEYAQLFIKYDYNNQEKLFAIENQVELESIGINQEDHRQAIMAEINKIKNVAPGVHDDYGDDYQGARTQSGGAVMAYSQPPRFDDVEDAMIVPGADGQNQTYTDIEDDEPGGEAAGTYVDDIIDSGHVTAGYLGCYQNNDIYDEDENEEDVNENENDAQDISENDAEIEVNNEERNYVNDEEVSVEVNDAEIDVNNEEMNYVNNEEVSVEDNDAEDNDEIYPNNKDANNDDEPFEEEIIDNVDIDI